LTAGAVFADQDRRLREALFELVAESGYDGVTLRGVSKLAGVSTHSFYRHYANLDEFFGSICESTMLHALQQMATVSTAGRDREEGLRRGVRSLMKDFAAGPDAARLALVDGLVAGPAIRQRIKAVTRTFELLLAELLQDPTRRPQPRQLALGMVAGMMRVVRATALAGRADQLPGLADDLSRWILSLAREEPIEPQLPTRSGLPRGRRRETQPFPDRRQGCDSSPASDERERILRAVARLAAAGGLARLSIRRIRTEAGVSRRAFDTHFSGVTDAYLESIERMAISAAAEADRWAAGGGSGEQHSKRLVLALCAQAARNSGLAAMVLLGILEGGREGLLRREQLVTLAAGYLWAAADLPDDSGVGAEASAAAVWDIACAEIEAGRASRLPQLTPLLCSVVLAPVASGRPPEQAIR
jgi:AcrR family transcriptional regulator